MKKILLLIALFTMIICSTSAQTIYVDIYDTICSGYEYKNWNGRQLSNAGTYSDTTTTADDIDSITTLYLEACYCHMKAVDGIICEEDAMELWPDYVPGSDSYYYIEKKPFDDCYELSEISYWVIVPKHTYDTIYIGEDILFPFVWHDIEITSYGSYYYEKMNKYGVHNCNDTEQLMVLPIGTGLEYTESQLLSITPNPVRRLSSVSVNSPFVKSDNQDITIEVVSATGKVISHNNIESLPCTIQAPAEAGLYIVRIASSKGKILRGKLLVE